MALADVVWGTYRFGNLGQASKNGMRLGMAIYWSAVNSGSASVTATVEIWTENEFTHSGDTQRLVYSANLGAQTSYTNNSGGSPVLRATKTNYSHSYSTWGSSPGNVTFTAELFDHYWDDGANPTISRTVAIPARPGGPPSVDSASASAGIRSAAVSWTASGDPGITSYAVYRNNDGNQLVYNSTGTSFTDTALGNGQSVYYIVYAFNAAGNGSRLTNTVTTPSLPSTPGSLTANASVFGRIGLSWTASSGSGYTVTYTVSRYVTALGVGTATSLGSTTSTSWNDTTVAPYTAYTYTVTPSTSVGSGTAASVSATSMGGIAKVWNGTSWVVVLPKVWNGSTWVDAQARMWNGSTWVHGI
jgi:hypothetical protein